MVNSMALTIISKTLRQTASQNRCQEIGFVLSFADVLRAGRTLVRATASGCASARFKGHVWLSPLACAVARSPCCTVLWAMVSASAALRLDTGVAATRVSSLPRPFNLFSST